MAGRRRFAAVVLSLAAGLFVCLADDPPDSRVNPQSSLIETVDTTLSGEILRVRHTITSSSGGQQITLLTNPAVSDRDPHIAIESDGDVWVVWWRESSTTAVRASKRDHSTNTWSTESLLSLASETSKRPRIAHDGTKAWVSYAVAGQSGQSVAITGGEDPSSMPARTIVATTSNTGDLDLQVRAGSGALWVTWIDSSTNVGWSEYSYQSQTWSAAAYESYASDSIGAARSRIEATVLGN